jgi:hypothetical protein
MADRARCLSVAELEYVNRATHTAQDRVNLQLSKAAVLAGDGEQAQRQLERKCCWCFYLRRGAIVGHGFTKWNCQLCGDEHQHPNTAVPRLCDACGDDFGLCISCGGDIEMVFRTKRFGRKARKKVARV